VIYKHENPINGWCSKFIKPTKWAAQDRKRIQNVKSQWVQSNVHKNDKNYPKMWKPQGALPWKLGERKWRLEKGRWWSVRLVHGKETLFLWSPQVCHSYLQNCHSDTQNYKNATPGPLMLTHSLCWRENDMEMMWQLSSTEYWCPSSKIASPKCLKIIILNYPFGPSICH